MKKLVTLLMTLVLCTGILAGCGANYDTEESTVFVLKDGAVVSTDVEAFDEASYDKASLEEYVKAAIAEYVAVNGDGSVKMKSLTVEEGKAKLTLEYATAADYAKFNGIELFTGTVNEALTSGYDFDTVFAALDKEGNASEVDITSILTQDDYKVVIVKGNVNVSVKGTVAFASAENTKWVNKNTISIAPGQSLLAVAMEGTETESEDTEATTETESQMQDTEVPLEDDLLIGGEEETEVVFEFEEEVSEDVVEFSDVYTYIIYK